MSDTIPYVYVVVLAFIWRVMSMRNGFSFQLFENIEIKNKNVLYIEKMIMLLLPIIITLLNFLEIFNGFIIKLLLIGVILLDFLLQYLYMKKNLLVTDKKYSKDFIWWIVLIIIILIIV